MGDFFVRQMDDFFTEGLCFDTSWGGEGGAWGWRFPILCEGPEPPEVEGTGRMREAGAPRKGEVADVLSMVPWSARPTAGSHGRTTRGPVQRFAPSKRRPREMRGEKVERPPLRRTGAHSIGRGHARPNATVHGARGRRVCQTAYLAHLRIAGGLGEGFSPR